MGDDALKEIPKCKLKEVYHTLAKDLPISLNVLNFVKSYAKGDPDEEIDFKVFGLNGEPSNGIILASAIYLNGSDYKFIMLHCSNDCLNKLDVCSFLMNMNHLKWDNLDFETVYEHFLPYLMCTLQKKNISGVPNPYKNVILPEELYGKVTICLPKGSYRPLTVSDAAIIDKNWPYHKPTTYYFVRHCIQRGGGVGIIDGCQLISWAVAVFGSIGMVYTLPQYRKRGHAATVIRLLCQKYIEEGFQPYATIQENNDVSLQCFKRIGFIVAGMYHCVKTNYN